MTTSTIRALTLGALLVCGMATASFAAAGKPDTATVGAPPTTVSAPATTKDDTSLDQLRSRQKDQRDQLKAEQKDQRAKLKAEQKQQYDKLKAEQRDQYRKYREQHADARDSLPRQR